MDAVISATFPILATRSSTARFFAAMMVVQFFTVLLFYPETKVERATT
jgi:MFS transporter, SP family, arabinose:H+ symporter